MPFIGLSLIIQIALAIHVVKTGREIYWIYLIVFLPGIGSAIYFFTQILPELGQSRGAHVAKNSLIKAIDPQRELRKRKDQLALANTLENKQKLAKECLEAQLYDDAIELFNSCLKGVGEGDPHIMLDLAQAYFGGQSYQKCIETLDELIKRNPQFNSTEGHLLYARGLEHLDKYDEAIKEYEVVSENYPGEEGRVRYGLLLLKLGKKAQAQEVFNSTISRCKLAPKFYQKKEKHWIKQAKANLSS